jgi:hypothetical protein
VGRGCGTSLGAPGSPCVWVYVLGACTVEVLKVCVHVGESVSVPSARACLSMRAHACACVQACVSVHASACIESCVRACVCVQPPPPSATGTYSAALHPSLPLVATIGRCGVRGVGACVCACVSERAFIPYSRLFTELIWARALVDRAAR